MDIRACVFVSDGFDAGGRGGAGAEVEKGGLIYAEYRRAFVWFFVLLLVFKFFIYIQFLSFF